MSFRIMEPRRQDGGVARNGWPESYGVTAEQHVVLVGSARRLTALGREYTIAVPS